MSIPTETPDLKKVWKQQEDWVKSLPAKFKNLKFCKDFTQCSGIRMEWQEYFETLLCLMNEYGEGYYVDHLTVFEKFALQWNRLMQNIRLYLIVNSSFIFCNFLKNITRKLIINLDYQKIADKRELVPCTIDVFQIKVKYGDPVIYYSCSDAGVDKKIRGAIHLVYKFCQASKNSKNN